jgi:hypothetical protein
LTRGVGQARRALVQAGSRTGDIAAAPLRAVLGDLAHTLWHTLRYYGEAWFGGEPELTLDAASRSSIAQHLASYSSKVIRTTSPAEFDELLDALALYPFVKQSAPVRDRSIAKLALPALCLTLLLAGIGVWWGSLSSVDLAKLSDVGLVTALPSSMALALVMLTVGFVLTLFLAPLPSWLTAIYTVSLIVILFGTSSIVEPMPSGTSVWKHLGVADYISRHGSINPDLDAYFNWPGFFILLSFITKTTGLDPIQLARWTPLLQNLLYLGALALLFGTLAINRRHLWLAMWLFFLGNWVDQDYLSPQGLNYFLYLLVLAIVLRWFKTGTEEIGTARQRASLIGVLALIFLAISASHQLTPFMTISALGALVMFRCIKPRTLPLLMGLSAFAWLSFMAITFLAGHIDWITQGIGALNDNLNQNVSDRLSGSPGHLFVVRIRLLMTAVFTALALLGGLRLLIQRRLSAPTVLLAASPVPLILLQPYGGEMGLRVYLFALPGLALLAAGLFTFRRGQWQAPVLGGCAAVMLLTFGSGFALARYGNERMDYIRPGEIEAVRTLDRAAPPGSVLLALSPVPWRFESYESYVYSGIPDEPRILKQTDAAAVVDFMQQMSNGRARDVYLLLTKSETAQVDLFSGLPAGSAERLVAEVASSPDVRVAFQNDAATTLVLAASQDAPQAPEPSAGVRPA